MQGVQSVQGVRLEQSLQKRELMSYSNSENIHLKDTDKNFEKYLCFKINLSVWLIN